MRVPSLGSSTYSFLWNRTLEDALAALDSLGFASAEIMATAPHIDLTDDHRLSEETFHKSVAKAQIELVSLNPPGLDVNLASPDTSMRSWSIHHYQRMALLASSIGAPFLVVVPGRRHPLLPAPLDQSIQWVADGVSQIAEVASERGVEILMENTPSNILDTAAELRDFVGGFNEQAIGICYDVANGHMVEEDPAPSISSLDGLVRLIHLSDTTRVQWRHDPIGDGVLTFDSLAKTLELLEFPPHIVLETIHTSDVLQGLAADQKALAQAGMKV